jgi:LacI family transcriptional regulator
MSAIHDVAKRAGVAPMTVSRVVNNNGYVSEETRRRVEAAIRELDYVPNALGSSLRSKRTQTLALVLSDIGNPFWTTVARAVEDTANKCGYHIIIGNTDESPEKQNEYLTFLMKKQVDGFLLVPTSADTLLPLQKRGVSFVVLDQHYPDTHFDTVRGDSTGGAYALTQHLLELGHRRLAIITGPRELPTAEDRVAAFLQAIEAAGISEPPQIYWGDFNHETGYECTRRILRSSPRPTAIFATNNSITVGTMRALLEAKMRIPDEMSVVGFDEFPPAITYDPFLTVAAQPAYQIGQKATELLLSRLDGIGPGDPQEIVFPVEIIVRRSSGKPPPQLSP